MNNTRIPDYVDGLAWDHAQPWHYIHCRGQGSAEQLVAWMSQHGWKFMTATDGTVKVQTGNQWAMEHLRRRARDLGYTTIQAA